jgi:hypothetical protein
LGPPTLHMYDLTRSWPRPALKDFAGPIESPNRPSNGPPRSGPRLGPKWRDDWDPQSGLQSVRNRGFRSGPQLGAQLRPDWDSQSGLQNPLTGNSDRRPDSEPVKARLGLSIGPAKSFNAGCLMGTPITDPVEARLGVPIESPTGFQPVLMRPPPDWRPVGGRQ